MANKGSRILAFATVVALLASGAYELVREAVFGSTKGIPSKSKIMNVAIAAESTDVAVENQTFSLFDQSVVKALKANAEEGAIITFSGSEDTYIFVSKTENDVTWKIDNTDITVTTGSTIDEEGKTSEYTVMSHLDSKKKTTRSLEEIILEDGEKTYLISKTVGKKTTSFPLTAEEYGRVEQGFKDPQSFDLILAEKEREKEIEETLYLFRQEAFDYLEGQKNQVVIDYPGTDDTYKINYRGSAIRDWWFNDQELQMSYDFETDEEGKKIVIVASLYHFISKGVTRTVNYLYIDYREEEPLYLICKTTDTFTAEGVDRIEDEQHLTPSQFAWAVSQFIKNPKNFDSILKKAPKRSSLDGMDTAIAMTPSLVFANEDGTETRYAQITQNGKAIGNIIGETNPERERTVRVFGTGEEKTTGNNETPGKGPKSIGLRV